MANKATIKYEELVVGQIDMVKYPSTGDKFLVVRSDDGTTEEKIPVIRTGLSGIVNKPNKNIKTRGKVLPETLVNQLDNLNRSDEEVKMELTEMMTKIQESQAKLDETLVRAESLFANIVTPVEAPVEREADAPAEETPVEPVVDEKPVVEPVVVAEEAPVVEAPVTPVEEVPVERKDTPGPMDVVRGMLDKISNTIGDLSQKIADITTTQGTITERMAEVERSIRVPNSAPIDNTEETVVRGTAGIFDNLIH